MHNTLIYQHQMKNIRINKKIDDFVHEAIGDYPMILKSTRSASEANIGCGWNAPNFVRYYQVNENVADFIRVGEKYRTLPGKSYHIFMEKINGITLTDALSILQLEDIYGIVAQILMALADAYRKYGFEHGDLHCDNIIIRRLQEPMSIAYPSLGMKIKATYLATLIDYGYSSTHDIKPDEKISMNDLYELYSRIARDIYDKGGEDYKNNIFYEYLVKLAMDGKLEYNSKPIEEWGIWEFYIAPAETYIEMPIDDSILLEQVNNIRQLVPQYFITDNIPEYSYTVPAKIDNVDYILDTKVDTQLLKELIPNPKIGSNIPHILYINGYWTTYAENVAIILILQNGRIDDYIVSAKNILKRIKSAHLLDDIYLRFFEDTLGI